MPPDPGDDELPIKLGPCSNGEHAPVPLSAVAAEAIRRTRLAADDLARRSRMSRRRFMRSIGGAALMLAAIEACDSEERGSTGETRGGSYELPPDSATDPDAARDAIGGDELILDVQTHYLDFDLSQPGDLGRFARGFPQRSCGEADARACFSVEHYTENVFLKSDTTMAVISAIPIVADENPLSIAAMEEARRVLSQLCGDERLLLHGQANPNYGDLGAQLDGMSALAAEHPIAAWKVYTHAGRGWSLDDEVGAPVGQAFLDRARELGITTVCVHKGLSARNGFASPRDLGPAATANPDLSFVAYHSGYETAVAEGPYDRAGQGVDRLVRSVVDAGIAPNANVFAELGSTWWLNLANPTQAAHILGKLLVHIGEDNILWGTDSIWYGAPQDQIQAFRAFEITPELQELHGYPPLTPEVKAKILGLNAARLYRVAVPVTTRCEFTREELEAVRQALPSPNRTYGPTTVSAVRDLAAQHGLPV